MGKNPKYVNAFDYFLQKVDIGSPDACWVWLGSTRDAGHGSWAYKGYQEGTRVASREVFKLFKEDPGELYVCHSCGNPRCCNPKHLYAGTPKQNQEDRLKHGTDNRGSKCKAAKLKEEEVVEIRQLIKNKVKLKEIARIYKISESTIKAIKQNRNWAHITDKSW